MKKPSSYIEQNPFALIITTVCLVFSLISRIWRKTVIVGVECASIKDSALHAEYISISSGAVDGETFDCHGVPSEEITDYAENVWAVVRLLWSVREDGSTLVRARLLHANYLG